MFKRIKRNNSRGNTGWTAFIIFDDLLMGPYQVKEFELEYQSAHVFVRDTSFFNQLEIHGGRNYYIGSYRPKKIGTLFNFFMRVTKEDDLDRKKILKKLKKKTSISRLTEIDYTQDLFKSDTTDIDVGYSK